MALGELLSADQSVHYYAVDFSIDVPILSLHISCMPQQPEIEQVLTNNSRFR